MEVSLVAFPSLWPNPICRYFSWKDSKWQGYPYLFFTYTTPTPSRASSPHHHLPPSETARTYKRPKVENQRKSEWILKESSGPGPQAWSCVLLCLEEVMLGFLSQATACSRFYLGCSQLLFHHVPTPVCWDLCLVSSSCPWLPLPPAPAG